MIVVCSLREAQRQILQHKASRVISILSPEMNHEVFDGVTGDAHLRLSFHDVSTATPGLSMPKSDDMTRLITFIRGWDRQDPMVIHCWAGISRSTAAGYIATCLLNPHADEVELAQALRAASPSATPNSMLVRLADDALGRHGRMRQAIATIGRGADAFEGTPFQLLA